MKTNPILAEIRQTRDDLARETGCDLHKLFAFIRTEEAKARARGVKFVSFADDAHAEPACVVREEPPKP